MTSVLLALALASGTGPTDGESALSDAGVRRAIQQAVVDRMGDGARVRVDRLTVRAPAGTPDASLRAVPPAGARTGQPLRFALFAGAARVGSATATVTVTLPHVRLMSPLARDAAVTAGDTAVAIDVVHGVRLERLPGPAELVGARARRTMVAGQLLTYTDLNVAAAVRSGDDVEVVARVGAVEARGVGRVSGSGHVGDWVRVTRNGDRRLQPARVVAPGVVELKSAHHVRLASNGEAR
jgi:flagella basal body P-ring formation protein FlgA